MSARRGRPRKSRGGKPARLRDILFPPNPGVTHIGVYPLQRPRHLRHMVPQAVWEKEVLKQVARKRERQTGRRESELSKRYRFFTTTIRNWSKADWEKRNLEIQPLYHKLQATQRKIATQLGTRKPDADKLRTLLQRELIFLIQLLPHQQYLAMNDRLKHRRLQKKGKMPPGDPFRSDTLHLFRLELMYRRILERPDLFRAYMDQRLGRI